MAYQTVSVLGKRKRNSPEDIAFVPFQPLTPPISTRTSSSNDDAAGRPSSQHSRFEDVIVGTPAHTHVIEISDTAYGDSRGDTTESENGNDSDLILLSEHHVVTYITTSSPESAANNPSPEEPNPFAQPVQTPLDPTQIPVDTIRPVPTFTQVALGDLPQQLPQTSPLDACLNSIRSLLARNPFANIERVTTQTIHVSAHDNLPACQTDVPRTLLRPNEPRRSGGVPLCWLEDFSPFSQRPPRLPYADVSGLPRFFPPLRTPRRGKVPENSNEFFNAFFDPVFDGDRAVWLRYREIEEEIWYQRWDQHHGFTRWARYSIGFTAGGRTSQHHRLSILEAEWKTFQALVKHSLERGWLPLRDPTHILRRQHDSRAFGPAFDSGDGIDDRSPAGAADLSVSNHVTNQRLMAINGRVATDSGIISSADRQSAGNPTIIPGPEGSPIDFSVLVPPDAHESESAHKYWTDQDTLLFRCGEGDGLQLDDHELLAMVESSGLKGAKDIVRYSHIRKRINALAADTGATTNGSSIGTRNATSAKPATALDKGNLRKRKNRTAVIDIPDISSESDSDSTPKR